MKNIEFECCRQLIIKFVEEPNFPREVKLAKKLLYLSPDLDSWLKLTLPHKINSLAFFLTENGKPYIPESQQNPYLLDLEKLKGNKKNKVDFTIIS